MNFFLNMHDVVLNVSCLPPALRLEAMTVIELLQFEVTTVGSAHILTSNNACDLQEVAFRLKLDSLCQ